jgi:hypothetical protein
MPTAATSPASRLETMPSRPVARKAPSDVSAVMLFHWRIDVSQSALPDEAVGEIEPNVWSWRVHHGATTSR